MWKEGGRSAWCSSRRQPSDDRKATLQEVGGSDSRGSTEEREENTLFKKVVNDSVKKKKRVTFGRELSPELFDKTLPANTPLRRGSTPYSQSISEIATSPAWEDTCQSPCQPIQQPDFDCNDEEVTLEPLSLCFDGESPTEDAPVSSISPDNCTPTLKEQEDAPQEVESREERKEFLIPCESPGNTSSPLLDSNIADEAFIAPEPSTDPAYGRVTRASNKSKTCSSEDPPADDHLQTAESSDVQVAVKAKRSRKPVVGKKAQVKAPRVRGKKTRGRPKKSVKTPLPENRETVSKKPLLSPIPELPECLPTPPAHAVPYDSAHGKTVTKGLVERLPKTKTVKRRSGKVQQSNNFEVVVSLDPMIKKAEDVPEDAHCPRQETVQIQNSYSLRNTQAEPKGLVSLVDMPSDECLLSWHDEENQEDQTFVHKQVQSVIVTDLQNKDTTEETSATKPQYRSKRRSSSQICLSHTAIAPVINTEILANEEMNEGQTFEYKPVQSVIVTVLEKDTTEATSAMKPQYRSKRRSSSQRRVSHTTAAAPVKNTEIPAKEQMHEGQTFEYKPVPSVVVTDLENKDITEATSAVKPQYRSKRRSSSQRRVSHTTAAATVKNTEIPADLLICSDDVKNTIETINKDPKPEADAPLAEDKAFAPKLSIINAASGAKGRRSSKIHRSSAIFCPVPEQNIQTENTSTLPSHFDDHLPFEVCLPIDETLHSTQTEKKVRRSMRLRRDSGVVGLTWVQKNTDIEETSRRRSLSSTVRPTEDSTEGSEFVLENVTNSPNKENLSVQHVPNAAKKSRRRTLGTSVLQETSSRNGHKQRRSNISYKDFNAHPSVAKPDHNITLGL